ncbi:MAG: gluconate 2-dehydrogenase subunit 3 family protein [Balneolaceae bacterium]|nr:MAG: gluconate 2-dehydrogenase subunit 3 family protein [Balneolaceae bacterium]
MDNRAEGMERFSRRQFLKVSAIWAGGTWVIGMPALQGKSFTVLSEQEAVIMDALADTIIPPDEEYVGGREAMVTRFLDQQLGRYGYLQREKERYHTCLPALNRSSLNRFGELFTELDEEARTAHLTEIEAGLHDSGALENGWGEYSPSAFFRLVRDHCMMGFYGSPQHGGNKHFVSFRMLGLT